MNNFENKPNFTESTVNLLRRLATRLHEAKIGKKLLNLTLAVLIAVNLTSCEPTPTNDPNDDTHLNGGNVNNGNNDNKHEIDLSKYSPLFQNVLTNEWYDELVARYLNGETSLERYFQPHPYTFLEEQGFSASDIISGKTPAYTMSYVLDEEPNNLYIHTRVQTNDYYTNYLICYTLTDEEMADYNMVHAGSPWVKQYLQAFFMNHEISKAKTPTILGSSKIFVSSLESMIKSYKEISLVETDICDIIFLNPNKEDDTFNLIILPAYYQYENMITHEKLNIAYCFSSLRFENEIYSGPTDTSSAGFYSSTQKLAKLYFPQNVSLKKVSYMDFESDINR